MLEHYFAILKREKLSNNLISKRVAVEVGNLSSLPQEKLWQLHKEGMEIYRKFQRKRAYPESSQVSLFDLKLELAHRILENCHFCERRCGANRKGGELGVCGVGSTSFYSTEFLHMGEEPELIPSHTIFFSGCTFKCCYCQNWDIAIHPKAGRRVNPHYLAGVITLSHLQGSRNVNFVGGNPDPHLWTILQIIKDVSINIPMIWNSNMYTSREALELLDGIIDLYLGDFRYGNDQCAEKYSQVKNYFSLVSRNFKIAYEQADVILRHLVLPGHLECCTKPIMEWVSQNIPKVYFNLMFQYYPCYRASLYPEINRRLTFEEREKALEMAKKYNIGIR